ncbi:MAG: site-specific integrase [Chloroflexi bacterium]|nr:MAG: site-specific integrase [Chloroflexota bacterium]
MPENVRCLAWPTSIAGIRDWCLIPCSAWSCWISLASCRSGLLDAAGAPRYTPHQLRHTGGSELVAQGQRGELVQRVLGHRDIRSTLGYAELQEAQVRGALERLAPR